MRWQVSGGEYEGTSCEQVADKKRGKDRQVKEPQEPLFLLHKLALISLPGLTPSSD